MIHQGYFAIIPANVRYDKSVPDGAKLLYGEITSLCDKDGYCHATNQYFADLYGKSRDTISRWMSLLSKAGHIRYIVDSAAGNSRKIWLAQHVISAREKASENTPDPIGKNADTLSAKMPQPIGKNAATLGKNAARVGKNADTPTLITILNSKELSVMSNNYDDDTHAQGPQMPEIFQKNDPPNSAPAPLDISAETAALVADDLCRERAARQYGITEKRFNELAGLFAIKLQTEGYSTTSKRDFRRYFFAWACLENKRTSTPPSSGPQPQKRATINRWENDRTTLTEKQLW